MDNVLSGGARSNLHTRAAIAVDLIVQFVTDELLADGVLENNEVRLISEAWVTSLGKATKLLDIISTKGQRAYNSLHKILREQHSHLLEMLEYGDTVDGEDSGPSVYICSEEERMTRGGVPPRPPVFITPSNKLKEVRDALNQLQDKFGWVLIHGIGGIGKSVLASEAVRSLEILELFPCGVFWVSISDIGESRLLTKLQNLCARLDRESRPPPRNLKEAKDRLSHEVLLQHPRCLLIIDDVWSPEVARIFDVQCRVLVTSRDKSVVDTISCPVFSISIEHGFSEIQALEMLALWTNKTIDELPLEAQQIYKVSKGHALVISLIGGLLRDHPDHWEYYLKKLREKEYSRLSKVSSYQYESIYEAICVSVEQLPDESKELYFDFVILEGGGKITAKVLSILWDKEMEIVEDEMLKLANKSLIRQERNEQHRCMTYAVHDLQLDFIKQKCTNLEEVHQKVVSRYKKVCQGKYHTLEDDGYIHEHLAMHMAEAHCYSELTSILLSLDWIAAKLAIMGSAASASILSDYLQYSDNLPTREEIKHAEEFRLFVSVNLHFLVPSPLRDVMQLALSQPPDSLLYKQAEQRARKHKSGFYVNWCNRPSMMRDDTILMRTIVHDDEVYCANFSPDANLIASCGEDGYIKIWESISGQVKVTLDSHSHWVNWCEFSPDGTRLLSCSRDKTIKLFNVVDYKLIETLIGHEAEVYMCVFSHNGEKAASCSKDRTVKIWDLVNLQLERTMIGHSEKVRCCQWSSDDKLIVSSSDDSTIKVFDVESGGAKASYDQREGFWCRCMDTKGRLVASGTNENLHIWEIDSGKQLGVCVCLDDIVCCAFSPNGNHIAAGCSEYSIWLWDVSTFESLAVYRGHSSIVSSVGFDLNGKQLISASWDKTVMIWKVDCLARDNNPILRDYFAAQFSANDVTIVTTDVTHRCLVIDENGRRIRPIPQSSSSLPVCSIAMSTDGKAACGKKLGEIMILSTIRAEELYVLKGHTDAIRYCIFNKDGSKLASASKDGDLRLWDLTKPGKHIVLKGHMRSVNMCRFSERDTRLVSSSEDNTLKVWDVASGYVVWSIATSIASSNLSPDGKFAVSGSSLGRTRIWDILTGKLLHTWSGDGRSVDVCCISPDSRYLATSYYHGLIKIWDLISGKELGCWGEDRSEVNDIKFSKDSRYVLTSGDNVQWWRVDGSFQVRDFHTQGSLRKIEADDAFQRFVTIDDLGNLYILAQNREPQEHALCV